ncbi:MAG: nicotinamide mononucleotide transporter [Erysipelotrichaceae bacterium]|nr:nicotinamide mononucleotide transporter [Erysipelotrichaceae bacterium]
MIKVIKEHMEPNKTIKTIEMIALVVLSIAAVVSIMMGVTTINRNIGDVQYLGSVEMERNRDEEEYDDTYTVCDVIYENEEDTFIKTYTYEEYEVLEDDSITAHVYQAEDGTKVFFDHEETDTVKIQEAYKQIKANDSTGVFNLGISLIILVISLAIVFLFSTFFTTYEKCWFLSIMVLATIFAVLFPEESANGVNGIVIMALYLLDTLLNILCELLISKQSRYNFLVSVAVEITEILICVVLMYRFATMVTTLFFWLPIDILSFINWTKHKDDEEDELTMVRSLKGWQEVLVLVGIAVWTVAVGYFLSGLDIKTDFFVNRSIETIVIYLDACASAVGVANGLFIFFRLREQWIAWYACAILEAIINIISGQYVLLVLKFGYITNTTYGYIKWSKYIKSHKEEQPSLF